MSGLIYLIACLPTRQVYVGSTTRGMSRWVKHRSELRAGRHSTRALQASFDTHGEAAHVFVPVEQGVDLNLLHPREQFWIWRFEGRTLNSWSGLSNRNRVATGWFADSLKNVPTAHLIAELASRGLYVTP